jgi:hypothetical protein
MRKGTNLSPGARLAPGVLALSADLLAIQLFYAETALRLLREREPNNRRAVVGIRRETHTALRSSDLQF